MHFLNALRWTEETFTKYLLRLPQQHTGIHIWVGPALPRFTPFGAMEGGGPVTAWFSVLTDVHLLPENGVLEERGQQTGREVNVRVPCQEQELWVRRVTAGQTSMQRTGMVRKASPRVFH